MLVSQPKYFMSASTRRNSLIRYSATLALLTSLFGCGSHRSVGQVDPSQNVLGSMTEEEAQRLRDSRYGEGTIPRAEGEDFLRDILFDLDSASSPTKRSEILRKTLRRSVTVLHQLPLRVTAMNREQPSTT